MKITNPDGIASEWEFESTGRQLQIAVGYVVGLDVVGGPEDGGGTVHTGYDSDLAEDFGPGGDLTHDERRELALFMIEKWARFGSGVRYGEEEEGGKETGSQATGDEG